MINKTADLELTDITILKASLAHQIKVNDVLFDDIDSSHTREFDLQENVRELDSKLLAANERIMEIMIDKARLEQKLRFKELQ